MRRGRPPSRRAAPLDDLEDPPRDAAGAIPDTEPPSPSRVATRRVVRVRTRTPSASSELSVGSWMLVFSVPTRYIGAEVDVRGDSRLVRIYLHGEVIKVHPPQPPGGRSTDYPDYPAEQTPYAMRAPDACICTRSHGLRVEPLVAVRNFGS